MTQKAITSYYIIQLLLFNISILINDFDQNSIMGLIDVFCMSLDSVLQSMLQDTHVSFKTVNRLRISYLKSDTLS